jgi:protocatechuate 3,4-dioxygenase beta subunit
MERTEFLKKGVSFLGMALIAPSLLAGKKEEEDASACTVANTETAGPFPTITPSSFVRSNIVDGRTGISFTINIVVKNVNNSCNPVPNVIVDIWHCDKDGNYSEYGGSGMQPTDYTAYNFLRGRQTTDAGGKVSFTSIFPGWYTGRATHIHVHIYNSSGTSLLISQIAFPEDAGSAVVAVNSSTSNGYTKGMTGYTYNASDNVFSDGTSTEMGTVTGSVAAGYTVDWDAYIAAPVTTGINDLSAESQFQVRQNFPNPCDSTTKIPVLLKQISDVKVSLFSIDGKESGTQSFGNLSAGEQILDMDVSNLSAGKYIYSVKISNALGTFKQSKLFIKH